MAPTEYRVIAKRAEPRPLAVAARPRGGGRGARPGGAARLETATGLWIRDGYGQTETGQLTGMPPAGGRGPARWAARCRASSLTCDDGELVLDPATDPTFFLGYLGERAAVRARGAPATACARTTTATCTSRAAPTT